MIGLLGLATYIFTAVFVYMSERNLEHRVASMIESDDAKTNSRNHAAVSTPTLPSIVSTSNGSRSKVSCERNCKDGFAEIDLERHVGREGPESTGCPGPERRKKKKKNKRTRLILFN